MRRLFVVLALVVPFSAFAPASAQEPAHGETYEDVGHAAGEGEADVEGAHGEAGAHETELDHLRIHGIGDLFSIPSNLPEEIREEREHLRAQLIAAFVNFGLLLAILVVKVRPMIRAGLVDRRASISKEIEEAALATGPSGQIPLNPAVDVETMVETPRTVHAMKADFEAAAALWDRVYAFLTAEFGGA